MPLEILHFRDSEKIIAQKNMERDVKATLDYVEEALYGSLYRRELLRNALEEMGWRGNGMSLRIIEGRRYEYKGFKRGVAIEANFNAYEFILEGIFFFRGFHVYYEFFHCEIIVCFLFFPFFFYATFYIFLFLPMVCPHKRLKEGRLSANISAFSMTY